MWEIGNLWAHEAGTSNSNSLAYPSSSYLSVMHELHVLVVDHDSDNLITTARLLESCQYRVSIFELCSGALQVLSSGKVRVDFIMANINSPDLLGFKLMQQAAAIEIPLFVMTTDDNALTAMRVLQNGAYGYVKKPPSREVLMCLWQHVLREKIKKTSTKQKEVQMMIAPNYNGLGGIIGNPSNMINDKLIHDYKEINRQQVDVGKIKRKVCTEWTQDLHDKFMYAVKTLGDGRCFPKEILEMMDVPGLTRMQVASHLQKCRNYNWQERKSMSNARHNEPSGQHKAKRFGSMPKGSMTSTSASKETSGGKGMKNPVSETEVENIVENMETDQPTVVVVTGDNNTPYYPQYEPIVRNPETDIAYNGNYPMNTCEDHVFNFMNMDCLLGLPVQLSAGMDTIASSGSGAFQFEPPHHHHLQQNASKETSMENGSPLRLETTPNCASDDCDSVIMKGKSK
ncbi:hypothetical protein CASFOL_025865 [Castilleja foliolosa]|uniref:Response regulatory domain-containing protein n=1 Tax=Castilleja foliolosa TaxID=1961234 RepID=A0ABD3CU78_9LAMI